MEHEPRLGFEGPGLKLFLLEKVKAHAYPSQFFKSPLELFSELRPRLPI